MTDTVSGGKPRKSQAMRFVLYAIILTMLIASLLWMRYEQNKSLAAMEAANAELLERQSKIDAERRRVNAAYALVDKAIAAADQADQIRIYDEIIQTYQDDNTPHMAVCVSWAIYKKALAATDPLEKSRLIEEIVDRYGQVRDKQVNSYVTAALREGLKQAGGGAEKRAFCDGILEKHGGRLTDYLAAWLMMEKAEATPDPAQQIVMYDAIMARFLSSAEDYAFDTAIIVALDKMALITDKSEQIRLCDLAIDAFLTTPQRTRYYLFDRAARKKAELVGDPSLPLKLYDQVIVNNVTEDAVVQARSMRMPFLKDDSERLAACDEFIAVHQDSKSDFVQMMAARAMGTKADLLTDPEAKKALLRSIIDKCAEIKDSRARDLANESVAKLAELSGDVDSAAKYYDEEAANAKNEIDAIRALKSKARLVKNKAEKARLYDEIIARGRASRDVLVSRAVKDAIYAKIWLIDDREEKIRLYDVAIAITKESRDTHDWRTVESLMIDKARLLDDKETQIRLYDEIIAYGLNSDSPRALEKAARAMVDKAEITEDRAEKIKLYDTALFGLNLRPQDNVFFKFLLPDDLRKRVELETEAPEKLRLYDRYLSVYGSAMDTETRLPLLLNKAKFMSDSADKSRLYDEIIEDCERSLKAGESGGDADIQKRQRSRIMDHLGQAILGQADLTESVEEKIKLYDRYLIFPQGSQGLISNRNFEKILSKKAELSGDHSIINDFYDDRIRAAATENERFNWYHRKARAAEETDRAAIEEEMITEFFDNTDVIIEGNIAIALIEKIRKTVDLEEKNRLCDRLIKRYGDSKDVRALHAVLMAYQLKAGMAQSDDAKLEIHSNVIDRYKDKGYPSLKRSVDYAVAEKSRLEKKMNEIE